MRAGPCEFEMVNGAAAATRYHNRAGKLGHYGGCPSAVSKTRGKFQRSAAREPPSLSQRGT